MTYTAFELDVADGVGRITLNQPDRGNPFDLAFCEELSRITTEVSEDPSVRCVLIDAKGRFFSVGADLKVMARSREEFPKFVKNAIAGLHSALSCLTRMPAPVVVAAHAMAAGGGVSLCAAADFCLATPSTSFYAAYAGIGLVMDGGASTFVPRRVGSRLATEFFLRNQTWTATEAAERGLINEVVPEEDLQERAWTLARELAEGPTVAYGEVKNLLVSSYDQPLEAQLELEARAMVRATHTSDCWEAVTAVLAKKKPTFHGR
jgi:2-(1,2-epoxy-1,2-dihydrophenyl)acetyl-CoA isomerase